MPGPRVVRISSAKIPTSTSTGRRQLDADAEEQAALTKYLMSLSSLSLAERKIDRHYPSYADGC